MRTPQALFVIPLALALQACGPLVSGNGAFTSEPRTVGAFKRVEVGNALVATLATGARSVTVNTDQNLQQYIEAVVEGDTLKLRVPPLTNLTSSRPLAVAVVNDLFEGVQASGAAEVTGPATPATPYVVGASGAAKVTLTGLSTTSLEVSASGASRVTLTGTATSATLGASGASIVDVKAVPLQTAAIDISGASTLKARVASTLSGSVSGASTALITGHPASTATPSGASTITFDVP
jgi:hypothetical protein